MAPLAEVPILHSFVFSFFIVIFVYFHFLCRIVRAPYVEKQAVPIESN